MGAKRMQERSGGRKQAGNSPASPKGGGGRDARALLKHILGSHFALKIRSFCAGAGYARYTMKKAPKFSQLGALYALYVRLILLILDYLITFP